MLFGMLFQQLDLRVACKAVEIDVKYTYPIFKRFGQRYGSVRVEHTPEMLCIVSTATAS
jgi:hypothetical protein